MHTFRIVREPAVGYGFVLTTDPAKSAGADPVESMADVRHQRQQVQHSVRSGADDHDTGWNSGLRFIVTTRSKRVAAKEAVS
jgi:hypothetical protein